MQLLIAGTALWCLTHLFPAYAPGRRQDLMNRLGENPYRGMFSLLIVASLLMIVFGWKAAVPTHAVYTPPLVAAPLPALLVLAGFILFFASQVPTRIKRYVRHPQMTGVFLWSLAHLLVNGDDRSLVLFGGLAAWSVAEILLINRRDGKRTERPAGTLRGDVLAVVIGGLAFAAIGYFHLPLFGVAVTPA